MSSRRYADDEASVDSASSSLEDDDVEAMQQDDAPAEQLGHRANAEGAGGDAGGGNAEMRDEDHFLTGISTNKTERRDWHDRDLLEHLTQLGARWRVGQISTYDDVLGLVNETFRPQEEIELQSFRERAEKIEHKMKQFSLDLALTMQDMQRRKISGTSSRAAREADGQINRIFAVIRTCESVALALARAQALCRDEAGGGPIADAETHDEWALCSWDSMMREGLNDVGKMTYHVLQHAMKNDYVKRGEAVYQRVNIQRNVVTRSGEQKPKVFRTPAVEPRYKMEEFVAKVMSVGAGTAHFKTSLNVPRSRKQVADNVAGIRHDLFPEVELCQTMFVFNNGVFLAKELAFYEFDEGRNWSLPDEYRGKTATQYFAQEFPVNDMEPFRCGGADQPGCTGPTFQIKEADLRNLDNDFVSMFPTPHTHNLFKTQWGEGSGGIEPLEGDETDDPAIPGGPNGHEGPAIIEWAYALLFGRGIFKNGELDEWSIAPFLHGVAGSGKSTILQILGGMSSNSGIIGNHGDKFVAASLYDKDRVICFEASKEIGFTQIELQSAISGESVTIRDMNKLQEKIEWKPHIFLAGNSVPRWIDNGGCMSRRIVLFKCLVKPSNPNLKIRERIRNTEMGALLLKSSALYQRKCLIIGENDIWARTPEQYLPHYFHKNRTELQQKTNSLARFIQQRRYVKLGPELRVREDTFKEKFFQWERNLSGNANRPGKTSERLYDDLSKSVYLERGIQIVIAQGFRFLTGVGLVDEPPEGVAQAAAIGGAPATFCVNNSG